MAVEAHLPLPYPWVRRHGVLYEPGSPPRLHCLPQAEPTAFLEARRCLPVDPVRLEVDRAAFDRLVDRLYQTRGDGAQGESGGLSLAGLGDYPAGELADWLPEPTELLDARDDAPVIRLVNALLVEAVRERASDVHIEPFETRLAVRLRVDGVLREVLTPPRELAPRIASRIKVMAGLDIAEKRLPQDGRIPSRIGGRAVDVRVSTIPAAAGERVVLRLLDQDAGRIGLDGLGLSAPMQARLRALVRRPHGIILSTGPTGAGKTTTLYALLSLLNDASRSILTVEDPIEYYVDGIGQTQVNGRVDMSFARGLRAILRQDPDVVMVGEIRDGETARIAVQASLTGHLVLSTLHTNGAAGAVTRLRDMGVEPFLLASSLVGVLAQRLVRMRCPQCAPAGPEAGPGSGCTHCRGSGFRGRTGVFELLVVDEEVRALVQSGAGEAELAAAARRQGPGLAEAGRAAVAAGITTLEEWLRVGAMD